MDDPTDSIVEPRQEFMVSPTEQDFRQAYFLKPTTASIEEAPPFLDSSKSKTSKSRNRDRTLLEVSFDGWLFPQENWKNWVEKLSLKHKQTWERAGIYKAIMGSTCKVNKYPDLVLELAKKWYPKTSTFVFDFAETTITLEDIMILGNYSVLGCPVFNPIEARLTPSEHEEMEEKEQKLNEERLLLVRSKAKKACQHSWMRRFMEAEERESESDGIEHEAFLSLWLSRFVFPAASRTTILKHLFPLAIRLARGTRIALAPAVLASIYRDLSFLSGKIFALSDSKTSNDNSEEVVVWAPFQLVQVWVWERFVLLQPERNLGFEVCGTRLAQWHKVKKLECKDIKAVFNSSEEFFTWRPYAMEMGDCVVLRKFYRESEEWLVFDEGLDEELLSFARCLRASELVGINQFGHFVEQYLPHRVARQFGMDQDLPGSVKRYNQSHVVAWKSYNKPLSFEKLYIPSRFFSPGVTSRYFEWWHRWKLDGQDGVEPEYVVAKKRCKKENDTTSVEVGGSHLKDKVTQEKVGSVDARRLDNGNCFSGIEKKKRVAEPIEEKGAMGNKLTHEKMVGRVDAKGPMNGSGLLGVEKKKHVVEPIEEMGAVDNKKKRLREENSQNSKKVKVGGSDLQDKSTFKEMFRSKHIDGSACGKIPRNGSPLDVVKKEDLLQPAVGKASVEDKRKGLREENNSSPPPGFSRKYGNKVDVWGSDLDDKSTLAQTFTGNPLPITEPFDEKASMEDERKILQEDNNASYGRCNKVEVGGSSSEDKLTLRQMLTSQNVGRNVNGNSLPMMEPVEKEAGFEDKKKSEEERLNDKEGQGREVCWFDLNRVDTIEARIVKAESSITKMKARRRGNMLFGIQKTKQEPIVLE